MGFPHRYAALTALTATHLLGSNCHLLGGAQWSRLVDSKSRSTCLSIDSSLPTWTTAADTMRACEVHSPTFLHEAREVAPIELGCQARRREMQRARAPGHPQ